jgi:hypothetical protein
MSEQELANKIYEAMKKASRAFYNKDQRSLDFWQDTLQSLTKGMSKKKIYELADKASLEFRQSLEVNDGQVK